MEEQRVKWDWALDHPYIVFARVSPAHKLLIVENAQRRGDNIVMTGGWGGVRREGGWMWLCG